MVLLLASCELIPTSYTPMAIAIRCGILVIVQTIDSVAHNGIFCVCTLRVPDGLSNLWIECAAFQQLSPFTKREQLCGSVKGIHNDADMRSVGGSLLGCVRDEAIWCEYVELIFPHIIHQRLVVLLKANLFMSSGTTGISK